MKQKVRNGSESVLKHPSKCSNEVLVDDLVMQKTVDGVEYARCFWCSKFFTPTIVNMELQLFCSKECEKKSDEYWEKVVNDIDW